MIAGLIVIPLIAEIPVVRGGIHGMNAVLFDRHDVGIFEILRCHQVEIGGFVEGNNEIPGQVELFPALFDRPGALE